MRPRHLDGDTHVFERDDSLGECADAVRRQAVEAAVTTA